MVSLVPVWVQFELGQLGNFANSFIDSLGWLLQGEFVVFPWSFRWIPMSFSLLSFWGHCSRLEEVRDVLVSSPGQPRGLVRTQGRRTL